MSSRDAEGSGISRVSLEAMVRDVAEEVKRGGGKHAAPYTLILGSGFSHGLVPTSREMIHDAMWWLHCENGGEEGRGKYPHGYRGGDEAFEKFRGDRWKAMRERAAENLRFDVDAAGLPVEAADNIAMAYQVLMSPTGRGLNTPALRRGYLDVVRNSATKLNEAHLYLAGILGEQAKWAEKEVGTLCKTIFTTNFDPFLQKALQLAHVLYFMSDQPGELGTPEDDGESTVHLVYAHGSVHRYELCNDQTEIEAVRKRAQQIAPYFERHGVIVIGYGGWEDVLMEALEQCRQFRHNLYWCGRGPIEQQGSRVQQLLRRKKSSAMYVETDADQVMSRVFAALRGNVEEVKPGWVPTPRFMEFPFEGLLEQYKGCREVIKRRVVSGAEAGADGGVQASPMNSSLDKVIEDLINVMEEANARAPIGRSPAMLMLEATLAYRRGDLDEVIRLLTLAVESRDGSAEERAKALYNRGVAYGQQGKTEEAIADYTRVVEMPDAPAEQRATALYNRGVRYWQQGKVAESIADYTQVIEMPEVPAEQRAVALYNRGVTYTRQGKKEEAIADYTRVIEMADAPAEQRASALNNRGVAYGEQGKTEEAIADCTRVIEMLDAPAEHRAIAFVNRGLRYAQQGKRNEAIADFTRVMDVAEAPVEQLMKAAYNAACAEAVAGSGVSKVIEWLRRARELGLTLTRQQIANDKDFDSVRGEAEFVAFVEGLEEGEG